VDEFSVICRPFHVSFLQGNDEEQEVTKQNLQSLVLHYVCEIEKKWGTMNEDRQTTEIL
jgi:hypothetical protein